jgi:hypothetical protein
VDKGLTRGTIMEGCHDLFVRHIGELGTVLGETVNVVAETHTLLLLVMAKLTRVVGPGLGALEVPYENVSELGPTIVPPPGEVLKLGAC